MLYGGDGGMHAHVACAVVVVVVGSVVADAVVVVVVVEVCVCGLVAVLRSGPPGGLDNPGRLRVPPRRVHESDRVWCCGYVPTSPRCPPGAPPSLPPLKLSTEKGGGTRLPSLGDN